MTPTRRLLITLAVIIGVYGFAALVLAALEATF